VTFTTACRQCSRVVLVRAGRYPWHRAETPRPGAVGDAYCAASGKAVRGVQKRAWRAALAAEAAPKLAGRRAGRPVGLALVRRPS